MNSTTPMSSTSLGGSTSDIVALLLMLLAPFVVIPIGIVVARFVIKRWRIYKKNHTPFDVDNVGLAHRKTPWRDSFNLWFSTSKLGQWWMIFQIFLTIFACVMLVVEFYIGTQGWLLVLEIIYTAFFIIDYIIFFCAASDKLKFFFDPYSMVDLLSIMPVFAMLFLSESLTAVKFIRAFRAVRALRIIRAYRAVSLASVGLMRQVSMIVFSISSMVFIFTCIILLVETEVSEEPAVTDFHTAFYWMIVTLSTVGYGDINPGSPTARMTMMLFISIGWFVMSMNLAQLIALIGEKNNYGGSVRWTEEHSHVVIAGETTLHGITDMLRELFHPTTAEEHHIHVVLLMNEPPSLPIQALIHHPRYESRVQILVGSLLLDSDLKRCGMQRATACFLLTNKYAENPDQLDAEIILSALAVAEFAPSLRWGLFVQVIRRNAKHHLVLADIPNVVSVDEMKFGLLGQACMAPGFTTLVTNLVRAYTVPKSLKNEKSSPESWEPSARRPSSPSKQEKSSSNSSTRNSSDQLQWWLDEYRRGCAHRLRAQKLSSYAGYSVGHVTASIYLTNGAILFAMETWEENRRRILVKPRIRRSILPDDIGYFISPHQLKDVVMDKSSRSVQERLEVGRQEYNDELAAYQKSLQLAAAEAQANNKTTTLQFARDAVGSSPLREGERITQEQKAAADGDERDDDNTSTSSSADNNDEELFDPDASISVGESDSFESFTRSGLDDSDFNNNEASVSDEWDSHPSNDVRLKSFKTARSDNVAQEKSAKSESAVKEPLVKGETSVHSDSFSPALKQNLEVAPVEAAIESNSDDINQLPQATRLAALLLQEQMENDLDDTNFEDSVQPINIEAIRRKNAPGVNLLSLFDRPSQPVDERLAAMQPVSMPQTSAVPEHDDVALQRRASDTATPNQASSVREAAAAVRARAAKQRAGGGSKGSRRRRKKDERKAMMHSAPLETTKDSLVTPVSSTHSSDQSDEEVIVLKTPNTGDDDDDGDHDDNSASDGASDMLTPTTKAHTDPYSGGSIGSAASAALTQMRMKPALTSMHEHMSLHEHPTAGSGSHRDAVLLRSALKKVAARRHDDEPRHTVTHQRHMNLADEVGPAQFGADDSTEKRQLKGHVLIVVCGPPTEFIMDLIAPMRRRGLRKQQDIMVMFGRQPSDSEWRQILKRSQHYTGIQFVHGNPLLNLARGSINTAEKVLLMNNDADPEDLKHAFDAPVVIVARSIESRFPGLYVVCELSLTSSIRYLGTGRPDDDKSATVATIQLLAEAARGIDLDKMRLLDSDFHFRPRFAAGRVFAASMLDSLICQAFLNPAVLAVVKLVLNPSKDAPGVYQIPLCDNSALKFVGKPYRSLVLHLLAREMLPLGLYRPSGRLGSRLPYVYTNPSASTRIALGDAVFVLADSEPLADFEVACPHHENEKR